MGRTKIFQKCVDEARRDRKEEGKQCQVKNNRHSSACPCLKLAQEIYDGAMK